jgi:hypothetical protein
MKCDGTMDDRRRSHPVPGERKSGIPADTDMPAPVITITFFIPPATIPSAIASSVTLCPAAIGHTLFLAIVVFFFSSSTDNPAKLVVKLSTDDAVVVDDVAAVAGEAIYLTQSDPSLCCLGLSVKLELLFVWLKLVINDAILTFQIKSTKLVDADFCCC